jgi:P27 family predicted phage terminase small subunit
MTGKAGQSGRKALPTKRTTVDAEGDPVAPQWLRDDEREKFDVIAALLLADCSVGELDSDAIALYCQAAVEFESRYDCPLTVISAKGNTIQHPKVSLRNKAFERMLKLAKELGLTPKSRAGLPKNPAPAYDPWEEEYAD